ncbi:MAG: sulfotransferase [Marinicellaceae bacterium]
MVQKSIKSKNIDLSIVLICYNMQREIIRTVQSFLAPYQVDIDDKTIEIIVIDTGSKQLPDLSDFKDKIKFIKFKTKHPSPVEAVNHGINIASSELIGVLIDGARMVTPGMCRDVIKVNDIYNRVFISTLAFHLGPKVQMESVFEGYNQDVEDSLLENIDWMNNGYDLYLASSLALSSINGLFGPIAESNAIFTTKEIWKELNGFDEKFISIGGGLSNLDVYKRACEMQDLKHIRLSNEATFHQVHGGVATNNKQGINDSIFYQEYESIHNKPYSVPELIPELYGELKPQVSYFFRDQLPHEKLEPKDENINDFIRHIKIQNQLNCTLNKLSVDINFEYSKKVFSLVDSPIILTGRGGSGTRILSQLIQEQGLFIGNKLNKSEDSEEWVEPIYSLINNRHFIADNRFDDSHIKMFRDNALTILNQTEITKEFIWGFKLPETMLCFPELFKAFPKARFIHLTRHPVNLSLRRSHVTSRYQDEIGQYVLQKGYQQLGMDTSTIENMPMHINNAISWQYQLFQVLDFVKSKLNKNNYCEVKYEDVCKDTQQSYQYICDFLGLKLNKDFANDVVIDQSRINKIFYKDYAEEIDAIWDICGHTAKEIGYSKINYDISLKEKKIIFVLGMHRSGTSAMTRVINIMGARVPKNLMQPNSDNQSGYWESKNIVSINNELLQLAHTSWFDNDEIPTKWYGSDAVQKIKLKAIDVLKTSFQNEFPESMVLKDPRFCRLMPFWKNVLNELDIEYSIVNVFRHPYEVFMSFKARFDIPEYKTASIIHPEKLNLLWLRYVLDAELYSREAKRIFINYQDLINYPVNTVLELENSLKSILEETKSIFHKIKTITDFLSKDQQHHNSHTLNNQSELKLSTLVFKTLFDHTGFDKNLDLKLLDDVRIKFNQIAKNYLPLYKSTQDKIHETTPWFEEISQTVLLNLGKVKTNRKILFLSGEPASKGHSYRVVYRMEALKKASFKVDYQKLENDFNLDKLKQFSAILMFRVTWNKKVKQIYEFCSTNSIVKLYDVDDLVFLPEIMTYKKWDYLRLQSKSIQKYWHEKFVNYSKALINSDHVIVPTRSLAEAVKRLNKPVSVIENGIGQEMLKSSKDVMNAGLMKPSEKDGFIRIGYASGSPTHQKDFEEVYDVLCQLFKEHENLKLIIVGYLELDEFPLLNKYKHRIEKRPLVEHMDLFYEYYRFDINIAPLQSNNIFCEGKSQLKYHESALVAVPTVASATQPYRDAIHIGLTGYYASNKQDWIDYLTQLIINPLLRKKVGETSNEHVIAKFGPDSQSMLSSSVISRIIT